MRKNAQFWAKYGVFKAQYLTKEASYDLSDTLFKIELLYDESTYVLDDSISLQQI